MLVKYRNHFLTGLLVVLPVFLSLVILNWLFVLVTNTVVRFLPYAVKSHPFWAILVRIGVLMAMFWVLVLIGIIARFVFIRNLFHVGEKLLTKIPLFNTIYTTVKQISEIFLSPSKTPFNRVVLVEFPKKGMYTLGFITSTEKSEIHVKTKRDILNVFVPTTPNPTTGFLFFLDKSEIIELEMSVEEGMKLVISGGVVNPPYVEVKE